jgi:hypothetical protein
VYRRVRPKRFGGCEREDDRRHPANKNTRSISGASISGGLGRTLPTSNSRSLASSSSRVRLALLWRLSSPPQRSRTLPHTAQWGALPRPPRAPAPLPPLRPLVREARDSTSQGGRPHRSPLLPPLPMMSSPESPGERVPATRVAGTPRPAAPAAGSSSPSSAPHAPAPVATWRGQPLGLGRGQVGPRGVHGHPLLQKKRLSKPR